MGEDKNSAKNINRRRFIEGCAKIAIGATFFSIGSKSFAYEPDTWKNYSFCMYKCPQPCTYDKNCKGCRSKEKTDCEVKNCAMEKEIPGCVHCKDLRECDKKLWENYPDQRKFTLKKQAEWGLISKGETR